MVLTSNHNLCFEHKYEKYKNFLSENFQFLVVKFSIYLNRRVIVMRPLQCQIWRFAVFVTYPADFRHIDVFEFWDKYSRELNSILSGRKTLPEIIALDSAFVLFVCAEVLRPCQPNGVMSSAVSLPNHTFTGQA